MNLRDIKKDIEYVLSAFVEDCSIFATVNPKASEDSIAKLLDEAVATYNEFKTKVNEKKIEGSKKIYFLNLRKELLQKTDALYEQLSQAVKSASKEEAPAEEVKTVEIKLDEASCAYGLKELDTTGDGIIDTIVADTTGDGKFDTIMTDTTGDGVMDTAFIDETGDGQVDSAKSLL